MLADKLGFQIEQVSPGPIQNNKILPFEADYFISKNIYLSQHHGIPTRLIDWTRNSVVACYFAIGREMRPNFESEQICVWACDTGKIPFIKINGIVKEKNGSAPAVEMGLRFYNVPNYQSKYLYSQQGLFSGITGKGIMEFSIRNKRFPSIEDLLMLNNDIKEPLFYKFVLSIKHIDELLLLLDRENVSQAHLMPTLYKVTETVISRWNY